MFDKFVLTIVPQNVITALLFKSLLRYVILKLKSYVIVYPQHTIHTNGLSNARAVRFAFQRIVNVSRFCYT